MSSSFFSAVWTSALSTTSTLCRDWTATGSSSGGAGDAPSGGSRAPTAAAASCRAAWRSGAGSTLPRVSLRGAGGGASTTDTVSLAAATGARGVGAATVGAGATTCAAGTGAMTVSAAADGAAGAGGWGGAAGAAGGAATGGGVAGGGAGAGTGATGCAGGGLATGASGIVFVPGLACAPRAAAAPSPLDAGRTTRSAPFGRPVSSSAIFATRRTWRGSFENDVARNFSARLAAVSASSTRAPRQTTLASSSARLCIAVNSSCTRAARMPRTLFAAMEAPTPLPQRRTPKSTNLFRTALATTRAKSG